MLDREEVIKVTKSLNFPSDQYLVIAGTAMAVYGIREASDIDIVAAPELFEELEGRGSWKHEVKFESRTVFLEKDNIEVASKLEWDDYPVTLSEAKEREEIIEGIPFMSLHDVIQFKQAYGRPKDFADIALIKNYLDS